MAKQTINLGSGPNTKTGDPLRTAFTKINANFTELYNAGGANTGSITFEGIAIIGDTTDVPQGSIELVPNSGTIPTGQTHAGDTYTSWGQYLRIFPTWDADAPHIHITAGSGTNSDGDLFLGNDLRYVQVNHTGTVSINTNPNEWVFDTDGKLTLPSGGTLGLEGMGWPGFSNGTTEQPVSIVYKTNTGNWQAAISLQGGNDEDGLGSINLFTYNAVGADTYGWTFTENGTISFPYIRTNQRTGFGDGISFTRGNNQKVISTQGGDASQNTVERLVIAGGDSYYDGETATWLGEAGDIYLWAGRGANGGDIKVDAGNSLGASNQDGGTIKIRGGSSDGGTGGFVEIWAGSGPVHGEIRLYTGGHQWTFKPNGDFQFQDNTTQVTAYQTNQVTALLNSTTENGQAGYTVSGLAPAVIFCTRDVDYVDTNLHVINLQAPTYPGQKVSIVSNYDGQITLIWPWGTGSNGITLDPYQNSELTAINHPDQGLTYWETNRYSW